MSLKQRFIWATALSTVFRFLFHTLMFLDYTFYPDSHFELEDIDIHVPLEIFLEVCDVIDEDFMNNTRKIKTLEIDFGLNQKHGYTPNE